MRVLPRWQYWAAVVAALVVSQTFPSGLKATTAPQTVVVDGSSPGRTFEGIGAESAGATTRLLVDYPSAQQSQILDFLFKPRFGMSFQILKVEIGADTNSTDGAEPSHMRTPTDLNCNRGYQWWLMKEAKARNPGIRLMGLPWGAPGWVADDGGKPYTTEYITYLLSWLNCAKQNNLEIDYIGGWNDHHFDAIWYKRFRAALDAHGYSQITLVADDTNAPEAWEVANEMARDPEFNAAIGIVGVHYPCGFPSGSDCPATPTALELGKPLWASELTNYTGTLQPYDDGAHTMARQINRVYTDGRMAATMIWPPVWSAYFGTPFPSGLILANSPWSGHYIVGNSGWVIAHTTQFAQPGWHYVDSGSARLAGGGSVVTLKSHTTRDWSSVIETLDSSTPQNLVFYIRNGLSTDTVHVWRTKIGSSSDTFVRLAAIQPTSGSFTLDVEPGHIYSLTTTTGQSKGVASSLPAKPFPIPYFDSFDGYPDGGTPRYLTDLGGAFETAPCIARSGTCLEQQLTQGTVQWQRLNDFPLTIIGDRNWQDYVVRVEAYLPDSGSVQLAARALPPQVGSLPGLTSGLQGYHLRIGTDGTWALLRQTSPSVLGPVTDTVLASGSDASLTARTWHHLSLSAEGDNITAFLGDRQLASVTDTTYGNGQVGLMMTSYGKAQFKNLSIEPR